MAEFKRLSDVEVVAEPAESANVLIEENGVIKKAPKTTIGGFNGGSKVYYIDNSGGTTYFVDEELYNILMINYDDPTNGFPVIIVKRGNGALCTMNYFRSASEIGVNYMHLNGIQCSLDSELSQFIVIAKTQKDATDWENADMV